MADAIAVSIEQGALMIGTSTSVLRSYIDQGLLPVVKFPSTKRADERSRRVLIAVVDLVAFVEKHRVIGVER